MAYKVIILYQLYMPSYFLGTFTEYPSGKPIRKQVKPTQKHRRKLFVLRISEIYQISVHDKS